LIKASNNIYFEQFNNPNLTLLSTFILDQTKKSNDLLAKLITYIPNEKIKEQFNSNDNKKKSSISNQVKILSSKIFDLQSQQLMFEKEKLKLQFQLSTNEKQK
jgi:hypothetical protein